MARTHTPPDIRHLAGYVRKPVCKDAVLAALRRLDPPVLLRQLVAETGWRKEAVNSVLMRAHGKGIVTRTKALVSYTNPRSGLGWTRPVYAYTLVEGE